MESLNESALKLAKGYTTYYSIIQLVPLGSLQPEGAYQNRFAGAESQQKEFSQKNKNHYQDLKMPHKEIYAICAHALFKNKFFI